MDQFETLYREHASAVFRFAWGLCGNRSCAEDLVSETFVRLLTKAPRIRTRTALAYLLIQQQDAVGLITFDEKIRRVLPARSVRRHLYDLLVALERNEPGGLTDVGATLHQAAERVGRRGLVILLSDLLDEPDRVLAGLKHFRHRGHEVLVFHILDPLERDLSINREVRLEDLETGEKMRTQPWFIREEVGERVRDWIRHLEGECRAHRIEYVPLSTDMPFDIALRRILERRARTG